MNKNLKTIDTIIRNNQKYKNLSEDEIVLHRSDYGWFFDHCQLIKILNYTVNKA